MPLMGSTDGTEANVGFYITTTKKTKEHFKLGICNPALPTPDTTKAVLDNKPVSHNSGHSPS